MKIKSKTFFKSTGIASVTFLLIAIFSFTNQKVISELYENPLIQELKQKLAQYNEQYPEDRVYLQFDKTLFEPGETIWFSAYLRDANTLLASENSEILHVELIDPRGNTVKDLQLVARNGRVAGDFSLSAEAAGGLYKVKAFTNWQRNAGEDTFFEKEITVQKVVLPRLKMQLDFEREAFGPGDNVVASLSLQTNSNQALTNYSFNYTLQLDGSNFTSGNATTDEKGKQVIVAQLPENLQTTDGLLNIIIDYQGQTESISRAVPIVLNQIDVEFFPEGGDLVENVESRVAFRAYNEFGNPADIEGVVEDSEGNVVADFTSFHQGMGAFDLKPETNENYVVKITKPKNIETRFELPPAKSSAYVLNCKNIDNKTIGVKIHAPKADEELSVVAQVRGEIYYASAFKADKGENILEINTDNFPQGVAQITVFDGDGVPQNERLIFANYHQQLNVEIETDKEKYLPREKVKMTIRVKDANGNPVPGTFSVAVTDDQLLSFADDKSGTILSELLLEQDLQQEVYEPRFYFDSEEETAEQALDYLLMTSGWRRFTWQTITQQNYPAFAYNAEKAMITGKVVDAYTSEPLKNAKVTIDGYTTRSDADGIFVLQNPNLLRSNEVVIKVNDYIDYKSNISNYGQHEFSLYPADTVWERSEKIANNVANEMFVPRNRRSAGRDVRLRRAEAIPMIADNMMVVNEEFDMPAEAGQPNNQQVDMVDKEEVALGEVVVMDKRDVAANVLQEVEAPTEQGVVYYRAREFAAPVYQRLSQVEVRNDFRTTIYWNPEVEIDNDGTATVEFYNCDKISSFRATVEGISGNGEIGHNESVFYTQLPVAMHTKVPVEVVSGDVVSIPLTLVNNTVETVSGQLTIHSPEHLQLLTTVDETQTIEAGNTKTIYLEYKVLAANSEEKIRLQFESRGLNDAFEQNIRIVPRGFPVNASFSGRSEEQTYTVTIENMIDGSLSAQFTAFPSVVSDLVQGVEGILREPSGCFEQTSVSSYPNLLVMDYLQTQDENDPQLMARAENLLDKGYNRLLTFETPEKGYEWFGGAPGHEALTAYGLLQFNDMRAVYDVDDKMVERTASWLLSRRNGQGGFSRNARSLDTYGAASPEITDAYIVYALTEAGYENLDKEVNISYEKALQSSDPYQMALMANALYELNQGEKADKLLNEILKKQNDNGSFSGSTHSITRSTGHSLQIETTSLVLMALIKSGNPDRNTVEKIVNYLVGARGGYGMFGSTQGTIMALKALTNYAKFSKTTDENGKIQLFVDGEKVATITYNAGENEPIVLEGLEQYLSEGRHEITVKYVGVKNPLPYSLAVDWNTSLPQSNEQCAVDLTCQLSHNKANMGETVRLTTTLTNKTSEGLPMTLAIVGIPAGLSPQPWQLKQLQEQQLIDFYEIKGNNVVFYFRQMKPSEVKTIPLDLKTEIPGQYEAQASSAYLYYTNELKDWELLNTISINN